MSDTPRYLLCTDLDRTLLPNGTVPELLDARRHFARGRPSRAGSGLRNRSSPHPGGTGHEASAQGNGAALYLAQGGLLGMNGNYSAGILEGFVHFVPQAREWLQ